MTGGRLKLGFALGAALAGMLAAALRVTGVSGPATAIADEPARPAAPGAGEASLAPAGPPGASTEPPAREPPASAAAASAAERTTVPPEVARRWRAKPTNPDAVTARVVTRAAAPRAPAKDEVSAPAAACAGAAVVAPARATAGRKGTATPAESTGGSAATGPCPPKPAAVEIEWHAPAAKP